MKKKILFVDDDKAILHVMKRIIKRIDSSEVYLCATAVDAHEVAGKHLPDLIISDYDLSKQSTGVDLALGIRG